MPALAKIQPKRVNILELINGSFMSQDRKEYWRKAVPTLGMEQKSALVKMLLDERDSITEEDARRIEEEAKAAEKRMWKAAENLVKSKDDRNANKILTILAKA